jgi:hypothetical protein
VKSLIGEYAASTIQRAISHITRVNNYIYMPNVQKVNDRTVALILEDIDGLSYRKRQEKY